MGDNTVYNHRRASMASPIIKIGDTADSESEDYDDESGEEDYSVPANDPVKATFDEIVRKVKQRDLKLRSKEDRKYFVDRYGKQLKATTNTDKRNLLHMLAYETSNKGLIKLLVLRHPELMEMVDDSNKTAFYIAISRKNTAVLMSMYENYSDIDKVLGMKYEHSENGMHAALRYKLGIDVIIDLVRKASASTLCAQDQLGRTPLHLAVEYERCTNSQLRLVREIIARDDGALDLFTSRPPLSVYQYHEDTRQRAQRKKIDAGVPRKDPSQGAMEEASRIGGMEATLSSKSTTAKVGEESERKANLGNVRSGGTGSKSIEAQNARESKAKENWSSLERRGTGLSPEIDRKESRDGSDMETDYKANEARRYRTEASSKSGLTLGEPRDVASLELPIATHAKQAAVDLQSLRDAEEASVSSSARRDGGEKVHQGEEVSTEEAADRVKEELKLHFLRSTFKGRGHDQAVRFLHGNNTKDIQISFDVFETLQSIEEDDFKESFENISFDKVLRYVALGKVNVRRPTVAFKFIRKQPRKGRGRSDLGFIFNWLHQKGVKQILKVIVDDLEDPAHSDEAIETSLERFDVEILDWRKIDLCPETIRKACKNLREVHLRWSGNNAILRAWSEQEGLAGLEHLGKVHLHVRPGLESVDRTTLKIHQFQERLQGYRSDVLVDVYREEGQSETLVLTAPSKSNGDSKDEASLYPHKWLETMDQFADQIQNVHQPVSKHDALNEPVKVALIDDGVDIYHPSLRRKIYSGTTFDNGYPNGDRPIPFYVTSTGHGTVMANMICRVYPMAKLYVFKLETRPGSDSTVTQITARSAADAVDAAVARNVHIISMSWTIKETEENGNDIRRLEAAMNEASKKGILMFCAAGDKGSHQDKEYPAAYNPTRIFRIGAAKANGNVWDWVGDPRNLDFILPGHEVVDRNPHGAPLEKFRPRTGSSVATALAAGLAALVLHCVRLSAIHTDTLGPSATKSAVAISDFNNLQKHDNMKAAFKAIGTSEESQNKFIEVWRHFSKAEEALRRSDQLGKLEIVANLARNLITKRDL